MRLLKRHHNTETKKKLKSERNLRRTVSTHGVAIWFWIFFYQAKYGNLINTMNTKYAIRNDKFTKDVTKVVDTMANYKIDNARKPQPKKNNYKKDQNKCDDKKALLSEIGI